MDSIIFDLDGTIWDSTEGVVESWNETIKLYKDVNKVFTAEDINGVMGLIIDEIAERFFPSLEVSRRLEIVGRCCERECEYLEKGGSKLYDGVECTLDKLSKKYKLFIVSNCECGYIETFFKAHGLDKYFTDYESAGRTGLTKGENIKLVMERNKLTSSIYVGDTIGDLKAARFADIPFVYAKYGFGQVEEYDYVIDEFQQLLRVGEMNENSSITV